MMRMYKLLSAALFGAVSASPDANDPLPLAGGAVPADALSPHRQLAGSCPAPASVIECVGGKVADGRSCKEACSDLCCQGPGGNDACVDFTGSVCQDYSCWGANACQGAGYIGGSVGLISGGSCKGEAACAWLAAQGGQVGDISGASCTAKEACIMLAAGTGGHSISSINNCCKTERECQSNKSDAAMPDQCFATSSPTTQEPTTSPTTQGPTTQGPTTSPTTQGPTTSPSTEGPTTSPTTVGPTTSPTTVGPTISPTTEGPTTSPTTAGPTTSPTTEGPTTSPSTEGPTGSPSTEGPTGSPSTEGPTGSPTTVGPTGSPSTSGPTGSPTTSSAPWTIDFLGIVTNFSSSSEDELVMKYEIGKNRDYEASLHQKDCAADITDVTVTTIEDRSNINGTHDLLTLSHSLDKSAIGNSTIWDDTTSKIEICQIVRLILPASSGQVKMHIAEDIREVDIDFTLSTNFAIENELGAGTIESAAGETNVSSYVKACKCNSPLNFTCESDALVPNTQLHVCITSVSAEVQVKKLQSMVLKQGEQLLNVILNGLVQISEIADMTYVKAQNGVVVSTFVPTNIFNYVAGASINITGGIDMELVNSSRRLLADVSGGNALVADGNDQEFELKVELQDEVVVLEGEGGWMDSSGALRNGAVALLGVALLLAHGMW